MTPQEAKSLLSRYAARQCTEEEENLVDAWFNKLLKEAPRADIALLSAQAMADDWREIKAKIEQRMPGHTAKTRSLLRPMVAAIAAVAIGVVAILYYKPGSRVNDVSIAVVQDTIICHHNRNFKNTLPDGTIAYLNDGSQLRFDKGLQGKTRQVFLDGEAYFEVKPDVNHPFIVSSSGQKIQVLGTHFNVRSYAGELAKTTLLEGDVILTSTVGGKYEKRLRPGEQATQSAKGFEVKAVDPDSVTSWKDDFVFEHTPLKTALKELARWYDVGVDSSKIDNTALVAIYSKSDSLPNLLKQISFSKGIKLVMKNNAITVE
jgi:ferric-dicitrate binding protein FerR (iron transport regulator)